jgi:hypothetical protein
MRFKAPKLCCGGNTSLFLQGVFLHNHDKAGKEGSVYMRKFAIQ